MQKIKKWILLKLTLCKCSYSTAKLWIAIARTAILSLCASYSYSVCSLFSFSAFSIKNCYSINYSYRSVIDINTCCKASSCLLSWDNTAQIFKWVSAKLFELSNFISIFKAYCK